MSDLDRNEKKIHADNIRRTNRRRTNDAAKSKPTEKAKEHFRRKAYESHKKTNADGKEKGHEQC